MEKIDLIQFVKQYLTILGTPVDQLDSQTEKLFYTISLETLNRKPLNTQQEIVIQEVIERFKNGEIETAFDRFKSIHDPNDKELWQKLFVANLSEYLVDLREKVESSLDNESRQKLEDLINSL